MYSLRVDRNINTECNLLFEFDCEDLCIIKAILFDNREIWLDDNQVSIIVYKDGDIFFTI